MNIPELTQENLERFWSKVKKSNGCWIWVGAISEKARSKKMITRHIEYEGYGTISINNKTYRATRISWKIRYGTIDEDMVLDHVKEKCTSTLCVNPNHLELVTSEENHRRAAKTYCKQGHLQIPGNRRVYISKKNGLTYRCKLCKW